MTKQKPLFNDVGIEKQTHGVIKAQRLRKDRYGAQIFPFYRVGRSILYDIDEIYAVIEAARVGGRPAKQAKAAA